MSKHRKDITLLVHCEKTYSGSKRGSMGCDGKSGRAPFIIRHMPAVEKKDRLRCY